MRFLFLFTLLLSFSTWAQHDLTGSVIDEQQQAVPFANVLLYKMPDSTFTQATTTNESGRFTISNVSTGDYSLAIRSVGYVTLSRKLTIDKPTALPPLVLNTDKQELDAVTVVAQRPTVTKKPDRLIFNVENTVLSNTNTANILKQTPGIVEMQGSYLVQNRQAVVYINNRRVYLSNEELNQLLNGYSGDNIKSIEVITNPPAQYDADGTAVININTSKALLPGYKGSINGSYTIDERAKYRIGTSQFFKNDWLNVYANYNYNPRQDVLREENQIGYVDGMNNPDDRWFIDLEDVNRSDAHNLNAIIDMQLSGSTSLNVSGNLTINNNQTSDTSVETLILDINNNSFNGFNTNSDFQLSRDNGFLNTTLEHNFENGGVLSATAGYVFNNYTQLQQLRSSFFNDSGATTGTNSFNTDAALEIDIYTGKVDYTKRIGAYDLATGFKYSSVRSTSSQDLFDTNGGAPVLQTNASDLFDYDEDIIAVYAQVDRSWEKWGFTAGIRAENTDVTGDSRSLGLVNTQDYFELFPNLSVTHQVSQSNSFTASYKRSIDRPRYSSLNPFSTFINDSIIDTGNPNLRPSFSNKYNLGWNHKNSYFVDVYYLYSDNLLAIVPFQDNTNRVLNTQNINLNYELQYSIDASTFQFMNENWITSLNASLFYMENELTAVQSGNVDKVNSTTGFYISNKNRFTLSKDRTLSLDYSTSYLSSILFGSYEYENQLTSSISINKNLWNKRAVVSLTYNDIFLSQNQPLVTDYLNQDNRYLPLPETNTLEISFRYKFGNFNLRNKELETPEEQERINGRENSF